MRPSLAAVQSCNAQLITVLSECMRLGEPQIAQHPATLFIGLRVGFD